MSTDMPQIPNENTEAFARIQIENGKAKPKVFFIRVSEEMYKEVARLAEADDRSINYMHSVLLGYALNNYDPNAPKTERVVAEG